MTSGEFDTDIELASLEDSPKHSHSPLQNGTKITEENDISDDDDDSDVGDEGSRALLGGQTRAPPPVLSAGRWSETKSIVLEVCSGPSNASYSYIDIECTHSPSNYHRSPLHWRTAGSRFREFKA